MEYLKNKYSEVELIKKDNWADIYVAINNETQEKVQLRLLKSQSNNKKYIDSITYEIDQLQNLKHKNLIGINGIYNFIEDNTIYYYIETEYFRSKTLSEKMILTGHTCKESLEIIKQVAEGLNEFHYRGLNYETLRGENIFINSQDVAKIDVLSYIQQKYDEDEEYDNYDEFDEGIDKDIYAVGVVLYQLITRDQNFKLRKLKKNIEDEEVYSMLYSLTSKNVKYRYQDLREFLSDVDEHLVCLSSDTNEDVQYINENKREIEDDFEEYEYESSKFVLIKRLCACAILLLVVGFGGMKVMALLDKDDKETNAPVEMIADEDSKDEDDLEENSEEETVDEEQVYSNDADINTNSNSTINNATTSNTNTNTNTDTENTTGSNNNSGTTTNRPSSGTTTNKPSSGTTTNKPSGGTTNKPSGGTTTKPDGGITNKPSGGTTTEPDDEDTNTDSGNSNNGSDDTGVDNGTSNGGDTNVDGGSEGEITEVE